MSDLYYFLRGCLIRALEIVESHLLAHLWLRSTCLSQHCHSSVSWSAGTGSSKAFSYKWPDRKTLCSVAHMAVFTQLCHHSTQQPSAICKWKWLWSSTILFMDVEISISHDFHMLWNTLLVIFFPNQLETYKPFLAHAGLCLLTSDLELFCPVQGSLSTLNAWNVADANGDVL